jgi:hypothetical protein
LCTRQCRHSDEGTGDSNLFRKSGRDTATCLAKQQQQQHLVFPEIHASWYARTVAGVCVECNMKKVQNATSNAAIYNDDD